MAHFQVRKSCGKVERVCTCDSGDNMSLADKNKPDVRYIATTSTAVPVSVVDTRSCEEVVGVSRCFPD